MRRSAPTSRLISRDFNLRFGAKLLAVIVAGTLAIAELLYWFTSGSLGKTYGEAIYNISQTKLRIFSIIFASYYTAVILGLVTLAAAVISILYSHRIAGPIYRLEKTIEAIGDGDLTIATRFRNSDALMPLADEVNAMVRSLNHKARSCADAVELMHKCSAKARELLKEDDPRQEELGKTLETMRSALVELKRITEGIKVRE